MQRGRLITLEGGEGAGKSTLMRGLLEHLAAHGISIEPAREPGGTPLGEAIRELVLSQAHGPVCAESELLLMFAARAQLVRERLKPALEAGHWVLCDRYVDASYAYQGGGRGQPVERVDALADWALDGIRADCTLLLDLGVAQGRERIAGRGEDDRIEREQDAFFERVRATYLARAAAEPERIHVIDATRSAQQVLAASVDALAPLLESYCA